MRELMLKLLNVHYQGGCGPKAAEEIIEMSIIEEMKGKGS
ncbi:hypothetical protein J2Z40_002827 [Cytobacillus eiseniae]|uniref:Uncharacterized protein n=1 Tax=Cytobacillus eiseniae TaxID=762947 RepID=A0ABS4RH94_9BACI|nr:hypothetical protein [Cytobacillus eiseniae]